MQCVSCRRNSDCTKGFKCEEGICESEEWSLVANGLCEPLPACTWAMDCSQPKWIGRQHCKAACEAIEDCNTAEYDEAVGKCVIGYTPKEMKCEDRPSSFTYKIVRPPGTLLVQGMCTAELKGAYGGDWLFGG